MSLCIKVKARTYDLQILESRHKTLKSENLKHYLNLKPCFYLTSRIKPCKNHKITSGNLNNTPCCCKIDR